MSVQYILIYIVAVNIIAFAVYGADKYFAKKHMWRVPESTLMLLAFIGGSVGALCAIYFFRHKTQHAKFAKGIPIILCLQVVLAFVMRGNMF